MRKLARGQAPGCLSGYRHGRDNWNSTSKSCRDDIRDELKAMQGLFCAYCESRLGGHNKRHIEHFYERDKEPQMTFDWSNMFWSCNELDSCGNYKNAEAPTSTYLSKVCKPDIMNPTDYLLFVEDGSVVPKEGLSAADLEIAKNTIQVFNLNASSKLVGKRREAARVELPLAETYYQTASEFAGKEDLEMEQLLEDERNSNFARIENTEHSTVLLQVWGF